MKLNSLLNIYITLNITKKYEHVWTRLDFITHSVSQVKTGKSY